MAKASLTRADYQKAAAQKGLEFIDMMTPKSVYDPTKWKCLNCGRLMTKSYRAVYYGEYGCRCRNEQTLKGRRYNDLAERLGIQWVPDHHRHNSDAIVIPSNTKTPTKWLNIASGETVEATYHQLAYGRIPNGIAEALGLDPEVNLKESV